LKSRMVIGFAQGADSQFDSAKIADGNKQKRIKIKMMDGI
jgi:hypothetical protein